MKYHRWCGHAVRRCSLLKLFDGQCRLRKHIEVNDAIREFIAADSEGATQRLIVLGQRVLGTRPFIGTMTICLHAVLSRHLGKSLYTMVYPGRFAVSLFPVTDRVAAQTPEHTVRCVLHSARFSAEENDDAMPTETGGPGAAREPAVETLENSA